MKSSFYLPVLFGALCLSFFFASCDKDDDNSLPTYSLAGDGYGNQQVPVVLSSGSAKFSGWYDSEQKLFTYTLKWYNLADSFTQARFHGPAAGGQAAGQLRTMHTFTKNRGKTDSLSNVIAENLKLSDAEVADLLNGKWYYNISSKAFPAGEVRGQINVVKKYE